MAEDEGQRRERFDMGSAVDATDGSCGKLAGVIIDPIAGKLSHLIIEPRRHHGLGKLVPVESVESDGNPIRLSCTTAAFEQFDDAEEAHFEQPTDASLGYAAGEAYQLPYYGVGIVGGMGAGPMGAVGEPAAPQAEISDRVPTGEVEVRRGDPVHASDGFIGKVKGLVVDPADNHVTHVLLAEGHFFGHKNVAIPIGKTARIEDEIKVELTKEEIEALPAVELG